MKGQLLGSDIIWRLAMWYHALGKNSVNKHQILIWNLVENPLLNIYATMSVVFSIDFLVLSQASVVSWMMTLNYSTHYHELHFLHFRHGSLFPLLINGLIAFECSVIISKSTCLTPYFRKALFFHQNGLPRDWQGLESLIEQTEDQLFKNKSKTLSLSISVTSHVDCLFMSFYFDFIFCCCWSTVLCSCTVAKGTS